MANEPHRSRRERLAGVLKTYVPPVGWLSRYRLSWLRHDLIAGLTIWAVMVPTALAYSGIAGVHAVVGLYAVPLALVGYALLGSSRSLVVGPDSATALLSAHIVGALAARDTAHYAALSSSLALLVGIFFMGFGLLRMGWVANFIAQPVMKGFIHGLALVTMMTQLPKLFGVQEVSGDFFQRFFALVIEIPETHWPTLIVGLSGLGMLFAFSAFAPRLPAALSVVGLAIGTAILLNLGAKGVALVGSLATGLPRLGLPPSLLGQIPELASGALAIVLLNYAESLGAAEAAALVRGEKIDANQELLGLGLANIGSGSTSGFVVAGSLSQSAVSVSAGGKTQMAALFHAAFILLTLLFLMPLFRNLPEAVLGAIVVKAIIQMLDFSYFKRLLAISKMEFACALTAFSGVLLIGVLPGVALGVILSLVVLIYQASHPATAALGKAHGLDVYRDVLRHPEAQTVPGLLIFRIEGNLFFANAAYVAERLRRHVDAQQAVRTVLIDAETIDQIDTTAADMLLKVKAELAHHNMTLCLARVRDTVRDQLRNTGLEQAIGSEHIFDSITEGVAAFIENSSAPPNIRHEPVITRSTGQRSSKCLQDWFQQIVTRVRSI
jgi:high affinity sulfate transporter 1